jgi:Protein of unknown function (DUF2806)
LAGETNEPGRFSKRTLAVISTLEKSDAQLFTALCSVGCAGGTLPLVYDLNQEIYEKHDVTFVNMNHLEAIGLIRFDQVGRFSFANINAKVAIVDYFGERINLQFEKDNGNQLDIGSVLLTKIGKELAPICGAQPVEGFLEYCVELWRERGLSPSLPFPRDAASLGSLAR